MWNGTDVAGVLSSENVSSVLSSECRPLRQSIMLITNPLQTSELAFPILEILHIAGFGIAIGTTAAVDFRILGLGMMQQTPSQISKSTGWWMLSGLLVAIFSLGLGRLFDRSGYVLYELVVPY